MSILYANALNSDTLPYLNTCFNLFQNPTFTEYGTSKGYLSNGAGTLYLDPSNSFYIDFYINNYQAGTAGTKYDVITAYDKNNTALFAVCTFVVNAGMMFGLSLPSGQIIWMRNTPQTAGTDYRFRVYYDKDKAELGGSIDTDLSSYTALTTTGIAKLEFNVDSCLYIKNIIISDAEIEYKKHLINLDSEVTFNEGWTQTDDTFTTETLNAQLTLPIKQNAEYPLISESRLVIPNAIVGTTVNKVNVQSNGSSVSTVGTFDLPTTQKDIITTKIDNIATSISIYAKGSD